MTKCPLVVTSVVCALLASAAHAQSYPARRNESDKYAKLSKAVGMPLQ